MVNMSDLFSDLTTMALSKGLDGAGTRHKAIANNIANSETPGYIRQDVTFEDQLKQALSSSDESIAENSLRAAEPRVQSDRTAPAGPNGNNVSVDKEMAEMTKNSLQYETMIQLMNMKISMLQTSISGTVK